MLVDTLATRMVVVVCALAGAVLFSPQPLVHEPTVTQADIQTVAREAARAAYEAATVASQRTGEGARAALSAAYDTLGSGIDHLKEGGTEAMPLRRKAWSGGEVHVESGAWREEMDAAKQKAQKYYDKVQEKGGEVYGATKEKGEELAEAATRQGLGYYGAARETAVDAAQSARRQGEEYAAPEKDAVSGIAERGAEGMAHCTAAAEEAIGRSKGAGEGVKDWLGMARQGAVEKGTEGAESRKETMEEMKEAVDDAGGRTAGGLGHVFGAALEAAGAVKGGVEQAAASAVEKGEKVADRMDHPFGKRREVEEAEEKSGWVGKESGDTPVKGKVEDAVKGARRKVEGGVEITGQAGEGVAGWVGQKVGRAVEAGKEAAEAAEQRVCQVGETVGKVAAAAAGKAQEIPEAGRLYTADIAARAEQKARGAKSYVFGLADRTGKRVGNTVHAAEQGVKDAVHSAERGLKVALLAATRFIHLATTAAAFGASVWVTFVSGMILYDQLPRHEFGRVQSKLFHAYFQGLSGSLGLLLLTFGVLHPWRASNMAARMEVVQLAIALVAALLNLLLLEPNTTKMMFERQKLEKEEGPAQPPVSDERATPVGSDKQMQVLEQHFATWHNLSTLANLTVTGGLVAHLWFLGCRLAL